MKHRRNHISTPDFRALFESVPPAVATMDKGEQALILVVEDNPEMNRFVRESLANEYRVESAFDGEEGLRKAIELRPDLILSDIMMPEMSGDKLVPAIRARRELDSTPVVLLTANADEDLRVKLLREGAQDYVMKPFSVEELRARVGNLVTAKRAQEALVQRTAQLQATNKELEAFSYSVSHDLRAPLRSIDGFSQVLEDHADKLDALGKECLQRIRSSTRQMGRLIDDLLNLSRLSRRALHHEPVDLTALAKTVAAGLQQHDPQREVEWQIADGLTANGDPQLLRVVLDNLLDNAWKFTSKKPHAKIEVGSCGNNGEREFFVRDNGAGFDMTYADKLFGAFQRLHTTTEFPGTGIGLATVQRIIHRHGGRVWAEAAVEEGAAFHFALNQEGGT